MRLELTILGTASQSPTRDRGQGGLALRWADEVILFDPGEGAQRQLLLAGLSPARVDRICITHFHGDHCLGLSGLLQSRALATDRRVDLHYEASGEDFVDHLLGGSVIDFDLRVNRRPMRAGESIDTPRYRLSCEALDHPTPTVGYRLDGNRHRHLRPERLAALGVDAELVRDLLDPDDAVPGISGVSLADITEVRVGPSVAVVMDTRECPGARRLADGVDLLICESTFLDSERQMATDHHHLTARQAATLAADAEVGQLVLTHFSNRYDDVAAFEEEARTVFDRTVAARDLACVAVMASPRRIDEPYG